MIIHIVQCHLVYNRFSVFIVTGMDQSQYHPHAMLHSVPRPCEFICIW